MAKILRNESSLRRRQDAIRRELEFRQITRIIAWSIVLAIVVWGLLTTIRGGSFAGVVVAGVVIMLGAGYEMRLREIEK